MAVKNTVVAVLNNTLLADILLIVIFPFITPFIYRLKYFYGLQGSFAQKCSVILVDIHASANTLCIQ